MLEFGIARINNGRIFADDVELYQNETHGTLTDLDSSILFKKSLIRKLIGIQITIRAFKDMKQTTEEELIFTDHTSLSGIVHNPGLKTSGSTRCRGAFADIGETEQKNIL